MRARQAAGTSGWKRSWPRLTARRCTILQDAQAQYALGNLLIQTGRPADAEQAYAQAIGLEGRYVDARYALARLYNDQGRYDEALTALDEILKMDRYYCDAYLEKGYALAQLGDPYAAEEAQAQGLKLRDGPALSSDSWSQSVPPPASSPLQTRGRAPAPAPDAVELMQVSVEFVDEPGYDQPMSQMEKAATYQQAARQSQDNFIRLLVKLGIGQFESRWFVNLVSLNVSYAQLVELLRALSAAWDTLYRQTISRIEVTRKVEALLQGATLSQNQVRALSNLSPVTVEAQPRSSASIVGADRVWSQGLTGAGRKVAIIDTGVCDGHPDLAGKLTAPPAAQSRLPYVYGEAIQGGNYFYEVAIRPGLTNVVVELVTGLEFGHEQLQAGLRVGQARPVHLRARQHPAPPHSRKAGRGGWRLFPQVLPVPAQGRGREIPGAHSRVERRPRPHSLARGIVQAVGQGHDQLSRRDPVLCGPPR